MDIDKRYQVFVSSTYRDLREEREEVMRALLELDCIPAGMELFPASDEERWELIKRVINDCDYYIVIVGGRYGSTDEEGISYTEREYDYAVSKDIPVMGFVHGNPDAIPVKDAEMSEEAREKLEAFRKKVEDRMCRYWTSAQELGGAVSRSLIQTMKRQPQVGWIRGDRAMSSDVLQELTELRALNQQLQAEVSSQAAAPPPNTEHLAQGDEQVEVDFVVRKWSQDVYSAIWMYSWNELIALLGPLMFDEASESTLIARLNADLMREVDEKAPELLEKIIGGANIVVRATSFHAVKVQLAALGVIEKSIRQRSVKDKNAYWKLTPYGESLVFALSAIESGQTRPIWNTSSDKEEEGRSSED